MAEGSRPTGDMRWLKKIKASDGGTALIEGAIVLPVILLLIGGVYEFGYFFYQQQLIATGVRDAARYLALTADPNSTADQLEAKNLAVYGLISGGSLPRVSGWSTANVTISVTSVNNSSGTYCGGCPIKIITVSTSLIDPSLGFFGLLGLRTPNISASHRERWVGGSAA
jgi:TadE-like protein